MANLTINTTQNIKIAFKKASLGERILAFMLDAIAITMYIIVAFYIIGEYTDLLSYGLDSWSKMAIMIILFSPVIFYSFLFESIFQGATIGKKILRIRVIKIDGYEASIADYFTRWALHSVDIMISSGVIGVLSIAFTKNGQRIGDIASGTAVISLKESVRLSATIFQEVESDYIPVYPQVISLSDRDIQIIKEALQNARRNRDLKLLRHLTSKVESVLKVSRADLLEGPFLDTVIKDYNYLTARV